MYIYIDVCIYMQRSFENVLLPLEFLLEGDIRRKDTKAQKST